MRTRKYATSIFLGSIVALFAVGCGRSEKSVHRRFEQNLASSGSTWRDVKLNEWHGGDEYTAEAILVFEDAEFEFRYSSPSGTSIGQGTVWVTQRRGAWRGYFAYVDKTFERHELEAGDTKRSAMLRERADEFFNSLFLSIR